MPFLSKHAIILLVLFIFALVCTLVWTLIENAYLKLLPGVKRVSFKEFWLQVFVFYLFVLAMSWIISLLLFKHTYLKFPHRPL